MVLVAVKLSLTSFLCQHVFFKTHLWPRRDLNTQPSDLESDALPLRHGVLTAKLELRLSSISGLMWPLKERICSFSMLVSTFYSDGGSLPPFWRFMDLLSLHNLSPPKTGWLCHDRETTALPWPGFEPGLSRPQREVLTTIRSRLSHQPESHRMVCEIQWSQHVHSAWYAVHNSLWL